MNPTTTILSLVAAALAGVTIVNFNDADLAKQKVTKAEEESIAAIRASGAKVAAAERKTFEAEVRAKAALAGEAAAKDAAKATVDSTKKTSDDLAQALADLKTGATKIAELEKARSEAAARLNEVNAEIAKLRDGSDLREAVAKAKKAEGDLAQASIALREANGKLTEATTKLATLEEELARLKADMKGFDNPSPNDRAREAAPRFRPADPADWPGFLLAGADVKRRSLRRRPERADGHSSCPHSRSTRQPAARS